MRPEALQNTPTPANVAAAKLPWPSGKPPLMLAPMQGLTNRAMRALFIEWVRPDMVFTEFMRVNPVGARQRLAPGNLREIAAAEDGVPLATQLIGHGPEALVSAAQAAQAAGAVHINLNLGCPYGRMTSGPTGGGMLRHPDLLAEVIPPLRRAVTGIFSVKLRAGYDDPQQIFSLLPLFEEAGVDFLVLHPRTVVQKYQGLADHAITARVVQQTGLPVIANGDIRTAAGGLQVLHETGAAGLMLGRGAIADPLLFQRLRGLAAPEPDRAERLAMLRRYLQDLLSRYLALFCGEAQVLARIKEVFNLMDDPTIEKNIRQFRKTRSIQAFTGLLDELC